MNHYHHLSFHSSHQQISYKYNIFLNQPDHFFSPLNMFGISTFTPPSMTSSMNYYQPTMSLQDPIMKVTTMITKTNDDPLPPPSDHHPPRRS